jgi:hypothetical protein
MQVTITNYGDYGHCPRCGSRVRGYTNSSGFIPEPHVCMTLTTHPDQRDAEIARLREALEWYADLVVRIESKLTEWRAANAEIARLREAIRRLHDSIEMLESLPGNEQAARLRAENDKLCEALRDMLDYGVELDDPRIEYMTVQIDRDAIEQARALLYQDQEVDQ